MTPDERQAAKRLLRSGGVTGPVQVAKQKGDDELVIVLPSSAAARVDTRIEQELQDLLHRKVWVVEDSPAWEGQTEEL